MDKKSVAWTDQAKADLRAIDQPTALRILHTVARYLACGEGDVKRLQDIEPPEMRCASATTASASTTTAIPSSSSPSSTAAKPTAEQTSNPT